MFGVTNDCFAWNGYTYCIADRGLVTLFISLLLLDNRKLLINTIT